jgi:hypothetical protein
VSALSAAGHRNPSHKRSGSDRCPTALRAPTSGARERRQGPGWPQLGLGGRRAARGASTTWIRRRDASQTVRPEQSASSLSSNHPCAENHPCDRVEIPEPSCNGRADNHRMPIDVWVIVCARSRTRPYEKLETCRHRECSRGPDNSANRARGRPATRRARSVSRSGAPLEQRSC